MIKSLLIANRGEIACRIMKTAKRLGIRTVAVYSDADAKALHVRTADEAVHIGPSPARESYLIGDRIIAAAKATGAEAIHPGYGFLSENAEFAQKVMDAGLVWVGPNPDSILAMGLKDAAKKRMQDAGVPTTPGYLGEDQSPQVLKQEADKIGYPVLIKAVAGGGGKGMRKVDAAADFNEALMSCRREAASSFGDERVLLEKWITSPRHIEVQVFGDKHGNVVHLFERDCSLQRRHQKVIEEAPAPGMDAKTREAICAAAVRAAQAVDYVGAGTIEFIADASEGLRADRIWFMEMNTRLQVEHPVTEEITGQDLVEWQLRIASGETLPKKQDELSINGWAMEVRLYAEDPAKGFLPSIGRLDHLQLPENYVRIDSGVEEGDLISPYYDPMIAKLISHGASRNEAREELAKATSYTVIWPVKTNAGFLTNLLRDEEFAAGTIDTGYIERRLDTVIPDINPSASILEAGATALIYASLDGKLPHQVGGGLNRAYGVPRTPWNDLPGFRTNAVADLRIAAFVDNTLQIIELSPAKIRAQTRNLGAWIESEGDVILAGSYSQVHAFSTSGTSTGSAGGAASDGAILSPMPGKIIAVAVAAGDKVAKGQKIVTVEAMKMEHSLVAPFDGVVAELNAVEGGQINEGALLAKIEKEEA